MFKRTKRKRKDSDLEDAKSSKGSKSYRKTAWPATGGKVSDEEALAAVVASTTVIS